ncbi:hypothetical protein [Prosthecobacter sp.]|uniref:hypothetical protein n=1 Tax=Prosthecobacter sp. TaxID=1965333 RepID=UPI002AB9DC9D|nr:hypothetical protein [Prosthecobacter sp.]MDZ4404890.1 hypothetical protein [Prosthecobacter sp.]
MIKPDSIPRPLILVLLFVGAAWIGVSLVCLVIGTASSPTLQFLGQAGDTFGVVNSLFSGIAMCGAIYTVYLQTRQMDNQGKELHHDRLTEERQLRRTKYEEMLHAIQTDINELSRIIGSDIYHPITQEVGGRVSVGLLNLFQKPRLLCRIYFRALLPEFEGKLTGPICRAGTTYLTYWKKGSEFEELFKTFTEIVESAEEFLREAIRQIDIHTEPETTP